MTEKHPEHLTTKLILANKASLMGGIIDDGKLGLVGNHKFYILGDKLNILKIFFESKLCSLITHFTKYGQDFVDRDAFDYIPDIRKILDKYNEEYVYKYFEFSDSEIKMITEL